MRPLDGERAGQVPHGRLGSVVRGLRLRHVDDRTTHAADEDDRAGRLPLHEMARHARREEVGAVDIDAPQLLHAVVGVLDGVVVLGEAGGGDKVVDLAVVLDDLVDGGVYRVGGGDVGVVRGDLGDLLRAGVLLEESLDQQLRLMLCFLLCNAWSVFKGPRGQRLLGSRARTVQIHNRNISTAHD